MKYITKIKGAVMKREYTIGEKMIIVLVTILCIGYGIGLIVDIYDFFINIDEIKIDTIPKAIPNSTYFLIYFYILVSTLFKNNHNSKINSVTNEKILKNGEQFINLNVRVTYKNGAIYDVHYFEKEED